MRLGVCVFPWRRPVSFLVGVPGEVAAGLPFGTGCAGLSFLSDPDPGHRVEGGVSDMVSDIDMGGGSEVWRVSPTREGAGRLAGGFRTDRLGVSLSTSEVSMTSLSLSSSLDVPSPDVRFFNSLSSAHLAAYFLLDFRFSAFVLLAGFAGVRGCECTIVTENRHQKRRDG